MCVCVSQKQGTNWRPEIRLPSESSYVILSSLEWNTDYEVQVVAVNQQGKSQPSVLFQRTSPEPTAIPGNPPFTSHLSPSTSDPTPPAQPSCLSDLTTFQLSVQKCVQIQPTVVIGRGERASFLVNTPRLW